VHDATIFSPEIQTYIAKCTFWSGPDQLIGLVLTLLDHECIGARGLFFATYVLLPIERNAIA
jgi:hypothetical protein